MFYKNKFLFFAVLFAISFILYYFINKQIIPAGIFDNMFISAAILYACIIIISCLLSLIMLSVLFLLKMTVFFLRHIFKKSLKYDVKFVFWLNFTVVSYIVSFIIFINAITY